MNLEVRPPRELALTGTLRPPSDKSITQRALLLSALAEGTSHVIRPLDAHDTRSVRRAIERLGARVIDEPDGIAITGPRELKLGDPAPLDLENSGTGARLLMGVLAGRGVAATITGDASLRRRPMRRVVEPLTSMGAEFRGRDLDRLPLEVASTPPLQPFVGELAIASAQVKSAVLLAALHARGETRLRELRPTRAHTESLLAAFGAVLASSLEAGGEIRLVGPQRLRPATIEVPADPSSAAFFAAAAAIVPGSSVEFVELLRDPRRTGFFALLERMGARVEWRERMRRGGDEVGTLRVASGALVGVEVGSDEVPDLIDEIPLVAVVAACARGRTRVRGAGELRVKESDRLAAIGEGLARLGARATVEPDGFVVEGGHDLRGTALSSHGDHRIAMALTVAALRAKGVTRIEDFGCVAVSYPAFVADLTQLLGTHALTEWK